MPFFDAVASSNFKQDADGVHHFYPWGHLGRGYVIPSDEESRCLRKAAVKLYGSMALGPGVAIGVLGSLTPPAPMWVLVVLVLLCVLGFEFWVRRVTRGWPRSSERLSFKESFRSQALSHSAGALWFTLLGSSILVLLGVSIFVSYPDELSEQIGAVFLALVGVCGLVSSWCMLSHRSAHDRHRIRLYNRACREALQGDKDQAFEWLSKAAEAGYGDTDHMAWDTDLDSLRGDARFTEILSSIKDRARTRPGA